MGWVKWNTWSVEDASTGECQVILCKEIRMTKGEADRIANMFETDFDKAREELKVYALPDSHPAVDLLQKPSTVHRDAACQVKWNLAKVHELMCNDSYIRLYIDIVIEKKIKTEFDCFVADGNNSGMRSLLRANAPADAWSIIDFLEIRGNTLEARHCRT